MCPNFSTQLSWSDFLERFPSEISADFDLNDSIDILRSHFGADRPVLLLVDELSQARSQSSSQSDSQYQHHIARNILGVLYRDSDSDVVVTSLTPNYILDHFYGHDRGISYRFLSPLLNSSIGSERMKDWASELERDLAPRPEGGFSESIVSLIQASPLFISRHPLRTEQFLDSLEENKQVWLEVFRDLASLNSQTTTATTPTLMNRILRMSRTIFPSVFPTQSKQFDIINNDKLFQQVILCDFNFYHDLKDNENKKEDVLISSFESHPYHRRMIPLYSLLNQLPKIKPSLISNIFNFTSRSDRTKHYIRQLFGPDYFDQIKLNDPIADLPDFWRRAIALTILCRSFTSSSRDVLGFYLSHIGDTSSLSLSINNNKEEMTKKQMIQIPPSPPPSTSSTTITSPLNTLFLTSPAPRINSSTGIDMRLNVGDNTLYFQSKLLDPSLSKDTHTPPHLTISTSKLICSTITNLLTSITLTTSPTSSNNDNKEQGEEQGEVQGEEQREEQEEEAICPKRELDRIHVVFYYGFDFSVEDVRSQLKQEIQGGGLLEGGGAREFVDEKWLEENVHILGLKELEQWVIPSFLPLVYLHNETQLSASHHPSSLLSDSSSRS